jgi:hypothetical protein
MYRKIKDMTWPVPGKKMEDLEWKLRYGKPDFFSHIRAAEIITAYRQMISDPEEKRNVVCAELKK